MESWDGTFTTEVLDITNTGSGGFQENIGCIKSADINIKGYFDNADHQTGTILPGVSAGLDLIVGNGGPTIQVEARCEHLKILVAAKGVTGFEAHFVSNGPYILPS